MEGGKGYSGGQERGWECHLEEDPVEFGMEEKEGRRWKVSAKNQEERYGKVMVAVADFMAEWHGREKEAPVKRQ